MTRPLAYDVADAAVAALMRVFPLASVEQQLAVLGAVVKNVLSLADTAQRELALENVCVFLLSALKSCAECGRAIPASTDWRERTTEVRRSSTFKV